MKIHIREGDIHLLELRTRIPFKYGIATMTSTPHAFVRLRVEVDGQLSTGIAADHLPPKWFTKDPAKPIDVEIAEMLSVIRHARQIAVGVRADTPFDAWREIWDTQDRWGREQKLPPLLTHFGTSLVERALLDAVCRKLGRPFADVLRSGEFGLHGAENYLPAQPLSRINVRHTVGLADPLEQSEVPANHPDDGLPLALADCIRVYGLHQFKIKVSGQHERDLDRLRRIAQVVNRNVSGTYLFSLDGNEQFHSLGEFRTFFETLCSRPDLRAFFSHLAFVEQPLHRDVALQADVGQGLQSWPQRPPIIIDESDGELQSLPQALRLGYAGTSHKNCKGIFKGISNRCLLAQLPPPTLMTGEDLANIGPVALLQDLAVCATLGLASVERNGHHYFAGLSGFPAEVQQQILAAHQDLYHPSRDGWPTLTIQDGTVCLDSVVAAPFGVAPLVDVELFTPATE